jgi:hypothetical protein
LSIPDESESPIERKDDGYDTLRFEIWRKYPNIDPDYAAEIMQKIEILLFNEKKNWTTFAEIEKEVRLGIEIIRATVYALESLGYVVVNRKISKKPFICIDDELFFGPRIVKRVEKCLQEFIIDAEYYPTIRDVVGNLPENALNRLENGDLGNAIEKYNEAVRKLVKIGKIDIFPLFKWRRRAYRIYIGPKLNNGIERGD